MSDDDAGIVPLPAARMEELNEALMAYQADLHLSEGALEYLESRGVGQREIESFRLGLVSDPRPGHGHVKGMLAIPYLDAHGMPLTVRFRCIQEHDHRASGHGKYASLKGDTPRLFNIGAILRAGDEIHVTEGEFDAVILSKVGLEAVAIPGANNWQPRHRIMLSGFSRIWVWGDPDDAGAGLVAKITRALPRARAVRLTIGDVTETFKAGGAEALLSLLPERSV